MFLRFLDVCFSVLLSFGAYWSLRAGYAEYLARDHAPTALRSAIRWIPNNPVYFSWLAEADRGSGVSAIRRAVELNPRNASIWIEYSQIAEESGDVHEAEACLLEATKVDRSFAPRWLLAEFYYRRRDPIHFWPAVKDALGASYDDVRPLFERCWELTSDGALILQAMPDRADVLRQYLDFLMQDRSRVDAALSVAGRLSEKADRGSTPSLLHFCDLLLEQQRGRQAAALWNRLAAHGMVPYPVLVPDRGQAVTNGTFRQPFLEGFDWRMPVVEGVSANSGGMSPFLRLTFSGKEPENCEVLSQWQLLAPSRKYRLRIRYETAGLEGETGIGWRMLDGWDGIDLLNETGGLRPSEVTERTIEFSTGPRTEIARLVLGYSRALGTVRISGSVSLYRVWLEFAE
jgi:hypothetical protein